VEPDTSGQQGARTRRGRSREGFVAALVTIVAATALAIVVDRKGGAPTAATAAAVGRAAATAPAPVTPVTQAPTPPPVETSSSSTTTTTAAPPPPPAPRIAAAGVPASPPVQPPLVSALQQVMAGRSGCLLVEDDGATIFDHDSTSSFVPASTQKLLVAAAALSRLGPDYRFETKVVATRPPQDGSLGDAWLVGAGDPYLATPDYAAYLNTKPRTVDLPTTSLAALADELVAQGVRAIPGGLHPDESRYEPQRSVPTWKPSYVTEAEVGSLGALTVNEGLASWGPSQAVAPDPAVDATAALGHLLSDRGVAVPAPAPTGRAPTDALVVVASVRSAPLSQIVAGMLRSSDNYVAEMLVKEIDHQYGGAGLTAGGTARVLEEDGRLGLPLDGVHLADGSGLDVGNRATCRALLGAQMLSRLAPFSVLDSGLAIAGHTGTLARRFVGTPADTRLAAKTGWINGAVAMVGRIAGPPGRRFALVVNGNFGWPTAQAIEDRIVALLTGGLAPLG
jgi:D-alanyl-D-alanine carboxypeptidase/D-alanyl-D-alanine-endopeptidase (penicillin-binding protein 4)